MLKPRYAYSNLKLQTPEWYSRIKWFSFHWIDFLLQTKHSLHSINFDQFCCYFFLHSHDKRNTEKKFHIHFFQEKYNIFLFIIGGVFVCVCVSKLMKIKIGLDFGRDLVCECSPVSVHCVFASANVAVTWLAFSFVYSFDNSW